jgi:hypothetical protein
MKQSLSNSDPINCLSNRLFFTFVLACVTFYTIEAQQNAHIHGRITDDSGAAIFLANVSVFGKPLGASSNLSGYYSFDLAAGRHICIVFSCIGFQNDTIEIDLNNGQILELNRKLKVYTQRIDEVSVVANQDVTGNIQRLDVRQLKTIPNSSGNIETLVKTLGGVSSNNELSSQYSVRGGNYDENLVYVNDIAIYRPMLIRSGQQEGLSFVNPDMVQSIRFSAGGFDASYGDKLSSVLDIIYRKPDKTEASVSASLLEGTVYAGTISKNKRFSFIAGARYKTNRYLLGSLDTKGEYRPDFTDIQSLVNYQVCSKLEISVLGYFARNQYNFIPQDRETRFGTYSNPIGVKIYFDGAEYDKFTTGLGAVTFNYKIFNDLNMKFIGSAFRTNERESFDIEGSYYLNDLDNRQNNTTKDSLTNIDYASYLNHARNRMVADVYAFSCKSYWNTGNYKVQWGMGWQKEKIDDKMNEWDMIDSSGYSVPYNDNSVSLFRTLKSNHQLSSYRITCYLQGTRKIDIGSGMLYLNAGFRLLHWSLNRETDLCPRFSLSWQPEWESRYRFYLSGGTYYQPAFYREMRNENGELNTSLKSQKSFQSVAGIEHNFSAWNRPFCFTTELYYKNLWDIVPYRIDNVRLQYMAQNAAEGYIAGVDFKLNGEFVDGAESWASISLMQARERIKEGYSLADGGTTTNTGYFPMPTDQLINFNLYFQDYLPHNPSYKMHLTLVYGSRLPITFPNSSSYEKYFRMPPYRRVDIGFSKMIIGGNQAISNNLNSLRYCRSMWITAEIFNLLDFNNTNSYLWLKTVSNNQDISGYLAVPNHLTGRRFNLKLVVEF